MPRERRFLGPVCRWRWAIGPAALVFASAPAQAKVQRHGLFIANNLGDSLDETLAYAHSDADKLRRTLIEVGGFDEAHTHLLLDTQPHEVEAAFQKLRQQLAVAKAAGDESVLFIYFSGHSDRANLHLAGQKYPHAQLRKAIEATEADLTVLVLDACYSGTMTRAKGLKPVEEPFEIAVEPRLDVSGTIVLTASTQDELAQESDEFGGSYFSHYLVSGLRGAADRNNDHQVSIDEAYAYAYEHTLRATSTSRQGLQHPMFSTNTTGRNAVILTRPQAPELSQAHIELPPGDGFLIFADGPHGAVLAEVGDRDLARRLTLPPGRYYIRSTNPLDLREGYIELSTGQSARLSDANLTRPHVAQRREQSKPPVTCPFGQERRGTRCVEARSECRTPDCRDEGASTQAKQAECTLAPQLSSEERQQVSTVALAHGCDDGRLCTTDIWDATHGRCQYLANACDCVEWSCDQPRRLAAEAPAWLDAARTLWFRADDLAQPVVTRWPDRSSSGFDAHQSIVDQRPTFVPGRGPCGDGAVVFDGIDDNLNLGSQYPYVGPEHSGLSVFTVVKSQARRSTPIIFDFGYGAEWAMTLGVDSEIALLSVSGGTGIPSQHPHLLADHRRPGNEWLLVSARLAFGEQLELRINGATLGTSPAESTTRLDAEAIRAHPKPLRTYGGPFTIGGQSKQIRADRNLQGELAELQLYNEALSESDMRAVQCSLARRYGLALHHDCQGQAKVEPKRLPASLSRRSSNRRGR